VGRCRWGFGLPILAKKIGSDCPYAAVRSQYWINERADIFPTEFSYGAFADAQADARPKREGSCFFGIKGKKKLTCCSPKKVRQSDITDFVF